MKTLIRCIIAVLIMTAIGYIITPAKAGWGVSCLDSGHGRWNVTCSTFDTDAPFAKIINGPAARGLTDAQEERAGKWEAYCQPKEQHDKYGVIRLVYAHEGCEFGRTH